jgi:hypothetical protein
MHCASFSSAGGAPDRSWSFRARRSKDAWSVERLPISRVKRGYSPPRIMFTIATQVSTNVTTTSAITNEITTSLRAMATAKLHTLRGCCYKRSVKVECFCLEHGRKLHV